MGHSSDIRIRCDSVRRRGNIAVFSLFIMVVLLGMVAFAVDTGYILHTRTALQRTADAAAMAAANDLPDFSQAQSVVDNYIALNHSSPNSILPTSTVTVGFWNDGTATFTTPTPFNEIPNAIQVTVDRSQANGNGLSLSFAALLGRSNTDVTATSTAVLQRKLGGPLVGLELVKISGNPMIDSFRSSNGPYDPLSPSGEGNLASNGDIDVNGDAIIKGDAIAGKGADNDIATGATLTGNQSNRISTLSLSSVDTTAVEFNNDNDQLPQSPPVGDDDDDDDDPPTGPIDFKLNAGESANLPPGTYSFSKFDIGSNSAVNTSGKTVIYVNGDFTMAATSRINNATCNPSKLKILTRGTKAKLTVDSPFHGVLYAPDADVVVEGNADLFGAVIGKKVDVKGDTAIHYDEDIEFFPEIEPPASNYLVQ